MREDYRARRAYQDITIAHEYDGRRFRSAKGAWVGSREIALMARGVDLLKGASRELDVLDVPAGTGRLTLHLLESGYGVAAGDISVAMLVEAAESRKLDAYEHFLGFSEADVVSLPFEDESFDVVACLRLFGHLPPSAKDAALGEFRRVARLGVVVMCVDDAVIPRTKRLVHDAFARHSGPTVWFPESRSRTAARFHGARLRPVMRRSLLWPLSESYVCAAVRK